MRANFSLDYDVVTVEREQKLYLMAQLTADPAPDDKTRRPLNLSLVIDRSGSMAGEKIDYTRQAAQFLVQNLGVKDMFSVVIYNDRVETIVAPGIVTHKDMICQRIANIVAGGATNLSSGWLEGCRLVDENLNDDFLNRVILMSDGHANRGVTDMEKLVTIAEQKRAERISTTTMGLGSGFNEDLMMAIANGGGGAFYFIESPEVAPLIFQEELEGLLSVVGQNLLITVEPTEFVTHVSQLNAYPTEQKGKSVMFRLGDVFGDEVKTLMLELTIPALHDIGQRQIANLRFEYDELTPNGAEHRVWDMPVMVNVQDSEQPRELADASVRRSVLLLQAAQARRQAVQAADKRDYEAAGTVLRAVADAIEKDMAGDDKLQEEFAALQKQIAEMERGAETYDEYSRKTMQTQAFYTMTSRHEQTVMLREREMERGVAQARATQQTGVVEADIPDVPKKPGVTPTYFTWNNQTYPLEGDLIRMGRSHHNEITLNIQNVSRFHCQIRRDGTKRLLEDLGSTNGTLVDGVRLEKEAHVLVVGDVVHIAQEKLIFHDNPDGI